MTLHKQMGLVAVKFLLMMRHGGDLVNMNKLIQSLHV